MLLEAEAFYSLPRLPETSSTQRTYKILLFLHFTQKDNSTTRNLQFIHSFICVSSRPSRAFQTFQGSTPIQYSIIRMHILQLAGFQKTPQSKSKVCRSIVRDESSAYFNVTAVNRYDI